MKLIIPDIKLALRVSEQLSQFGASPEDVLDVGFNRGRDVCDHCLGWIWRQWLIGKKQPDLRPKMDGFVNRGFHFIRTEKNQQERGSHDLLLIHCTLFSQPVSVFEELINEVATCSSAKEFPDHDRYYRAWAGMIKHWWLGDKAKALKQAELMWDSEKPLNCRPAPKAMINAWLNEDWKAFAKAQKQAFAKGWNGMRKDKSISSETADEIVIKVSDHPIRAGWCWADNGLATLAHRRGATVETDQLWFPKVALA